jgi:hypothetical protein
MADGLSALSFAAALSGGGQGGALNDALGVFGSGVYLGAGPIIQGTHHRPGAAVASVIVRLSVPLVVALFGAIWYVPPGVDAGDGSHTGTRSALSWDGAALGLASAW